MSTGIHFSVSIILAPDAIDALDKVVEDLLVAINNVEGVVDIIPSHTLVEIPTDENEIHLRLEQCHNKFVGQLDTLLDGKGKV